MHLKRIYKSGAENTVRRLKTAEADASGPD